MERKEAHIPVEGFNGVNRNVDREDIQPTELYATKNLWERILGNLETRWGSESIGNLPSNIISVGNHFKINKNENEDVRIAQVTCDPEFGATSTFPANLIVEFINDAGGYWNRPITTWGGETGYVAIRFCGYGVDMVYWILTTSIPGYSASTSQKLRVTITSSFGENYTGFEVYGAARIGSTYARPGGYTGFGSTYSEQPVWAGFQELITTQTGSFDFLYSPIGQKSTALGTFGDTLDSFKVQVSETGGSLIGGKTYYVACFQQYTNVDSGLNFTEHAIYETVGDLDIEGSGSFVIPVTIPGTGNTGSITFTDFQDAGSSGVTSQNIAFCIGEDPRLLRMAFIRNNVADTDLIVLTDIPHYSPSRVFIEARASNKYRLKFSVSSWSLKDMLVGINDDDTIYPIFITDMVGDFHQKKWDDNYGSSRIDNLGLVSSATGVHNLLAQGIEYYPHYGNDSRTNFIQWNAISFFTNDYKWFEELLIYGSEYYNNQTYAKTYAMTDGLVAATVPLTWDSSPRTSLSPRIPPMSYIKFFDQSVCLCGGKDTVVPTLASFGSTGSIPLTAQKLMFFTQANNPYNFKDPSAAQSQYFVIGEDTEAINGMALYTNTEIDTGPETQLALTKRNAVYLLNELSASARLTQIGIKTQLAGHYTLINTPIGLLAAAHDNVYLLRDNGEPIPMGQQISDVLKGSNLSTSVACYHDRHYKLSFYDPNEAGNPGYNNVEWWLNLNKVIEKKGGADWVGPMIGRSVDYCNVESSDIDGNVYNAARDRYCSDRENVRIYRADVFPAESDEEILDFATAVEATIETKDFDITQKDNNWNKLLKRWYWKIKTNKVAADPLSATDQTYVDGVLVDTQTIEMFANNAGDFNAQPLKTNRFFPLSRLRGRTVRKVLTTSDRIAISGFQINYEVERRRM